MNANPEHFDRCERGLARAQEVRLRQLPREVRAHLNRRAHSEGQRHAEAVKACMQDELLRLRAAGATVAELMAWLEPQPAGDRPAAEPPR
jgi:hypothetical protein